MGKFRVWYAELRSEDLSGQIEEALVELAETGVVPPIPELEKELIHSTGSVDVGFANVSIPIRKDEIDVEMRLGWGRKGLVAIAPLNTDIPHRILDRTAKTVVKMILEGSPYLNTDIKDPMEVDCE